MNMDIDMMIDDLVDAIYENEQLLERENETETRRLDDKRSDLIGVLHALKRLPGH